MGPDLAALQSHYLEDMHASDAAISNLDNVFPAWRDKARNVINVSGVGPDPRPWPQDPIEQLIWLSTSGARVWVPTLRQLGQLHAERRRRLNPPPPKRQPPSEFPKQADGLKLRKATVIR